MARHRSFSSEFKRQISREFLEGRAGMHELARRYSLSRNLIRLWVRKYEAGEFTDEVAEGVRIAEYERKVGQLTMEVDLLKKGARLARPGSDASYSIVSGPGLSPSRKAAESCNSHARPTTTVRAVRPRPGERWRGGSHSSVRSFRATAIGGSPRSCASKESA